MTLGLIHHIRGRNTHRSWPTIVLTLATLGVSGALAAPAIADPVVNGTPEQGQTLTVTPDATAVAEMTPGPPGDMKWFGCPSGQSPPGCTVLVTGQTSYTLKAADVGNRIVVREADTTSGPRTSTPTAVVFPILRDPLIGGSTVAGQMLQATAQWSVISPPAGASITFAWSRCKPGCKTIAGATGAQYTLRSADVGGKVQVQVSDTEPSGADQSKSAKSGSVTAAPGTPAPASPPVTSPAQPTSKSVTSVVASPTGAETNQEVTLIATVTASASGTSPSGAVAFANHGATIAGCGSIPASGSGQSVTVTCAAAFPAASSPAAVTAAFTPAPGSAVQGSSSATSSVTIRRGSSISSVDVSNPTVALGRTATYTASILGSVAGSAMPSGTAEFLDGGKPIAACATRPLASTAVGSQASCVVRYTRLGSHSITIAYPGDANFLGSGSTSATHVTVRSISRGTVNSTMQWSFHFTRSYTNVLALVINSASVGTSVVVKCQGGGCPFAKRSTMVHQGTRCPTNSKRKSKCTTRKSRRVDLESGFRGHRLRGGARVTIFLMRPQWVGKYYQFTIRTASAPRIRISCLAPGRTAPGVGC
jgi:hypothetical protein